MLGPHSVHTEIGHAWAVNVGGAGQEVNHLGLLSLPMTTNMHSLLLRQWTYEVNADVFPDPTGHRQQHQLARFLARH